MEQIKHTPGPWDGGGYSVEASDGSLVCSLSGWKGPTVTKANSLLISAAPEMAADLAEGIELIAGDLTGPEWKEACNAWLKRARGTLSKAIGA